MTNLITSLSNWLTTSHSIDLLGWQWIIFGGCAVVISAVLVVVGIYLFAKVLGNATMLPW